MRLCDAIMATWQETAIASRFVPGKRVPLPNGRWLQSRLAATKLRYILTDEVAALTRRLATVDGQTIESCLGLVRVPAERVWIEWADRDRSELLRNLGLRGLDDPNSAPVDRCGVLIKADEGGRSGVMWIAWVRDADFAEQGASLCPIEILFDLDDPNFAGRPWPDGDTHFQIGVDGPHHAAISSRSIGRLLRDMEEWLPEDRTLRNAKLNSHRSDTMYELQHALCLFLLLMARNKATELVASDFGKLNKARVKSGRRPLLDHIEVKMSLSRVQRRRVEADAQGQPGVRSSPRFHYVSGHLVRRGEAVFWRSAHTRGRLKSDAVTPTRTVTVYR